MSLDNEWVAYVNTPLKKGELQTIRNSVNRQAPFGNEKWQVETAVKSMGCYLLSIRGEDPEKMYRSSLSSSISKVSETYEHYIKPARSTVAVKTLSKNALVEIECIAFADQYVDFG